MTKQATPMARPGVHESWLKKNDPRKHAPHYSADAWAGMSTELASWEEVAEKAAAGRKRGGTRSNAEDHWWYSLHSACGQYKSHKLDELQTRVLQAGKWDHGLASSIADAGELEFLILLRMRMPEFGNTAPFAFLEGYAYSLVVLLVEGQAERALQLGHALVTASRFGAYRPMMSNFTGHFIINLLADHLGREPIPIRTPPAGKKAFNPEPFLDGLLASWKTKDPAEIRDALLILCDIHTQLAWSGAKQMEREFTNGFWPHMPLAAWLVMKLRELRGLKSPKIEHPIMDTALGRMPAPGYVADPIVARLRQRADRDGLEIDRTLAHFAGLETT